MATERRVEEISENVWKAGSLEELLVEKKEGLVVEREVHISNLMSTKTIHT